MVRLDGSHLPREHSDRASIAHVTSAQSEPCRRSFCRFQTRSVSLSDYGQIGESAGGGELENESPLTLPDGELTEFLARLSKVLSEDQIVSESAAVSRRYAVTQHRSFTPQIYLNPSCTEHLSCIIKLANQLSVAVYVMSKGRNWGVWHCHRNTGHFRQYCA